MAVTLPPELPRRPCASSESVDAAFSELALPWLLQAQWFVYLSREVGGVVCFQLLLGILPSGYQPALASTLPQPLQ